MQLTKHCTYIFIEFDKTSADASQLLYSNLVFGTKKHIITILFRITNAYND